MDQFAEKMIARGPTFTSDGTLTGSEHVVDLPSAASAGDVLSADRYTGIEVHQWQFGGRRNRST